MTTAARELLVHQNLYIGGQWVPPNSGRTIESIDPDTEDVWAEVPEADESDIDHAVVTAEAALDAEWGKATPTQRGGLLRRLADLILENHERLAELESRDNGKPIRDTLQEVSRAAEWFHYYAGGADKVEGRQIPFRPDALAYTRLEPVGVVAAITPWNSPINMYSWKLGPALAMGNTVVLKPAEQTSVTALEIAALVEKAGFPPGVVNVVPGYGSVAGAALVAHPRVNKVAFTGEHLTAQEIMRSGAGTLKRLTLECGGKAPQIIFDDADLDRAVVVASHAAFRSTGQSCTMGGRIFVQRDVYARFLEAFLARTRSIRVGHPLELDSHMGPHTSAAQLAKSEGYIQIGKDEGARVVHGGARPAGFPRGYYISPTVFVDVDYRSRLAQEEVFGPVVAIMPFDTEEEVVKMANSVVYGLTAGVWTKDVSRMHRIAARLKSGMVSVNTYRPIHWMLPYGGFKMSGLGRENGFDAMLEYSEVKTVVVELSDHVDDPFGGPTSADR